MALETLDRKIQNQLIDFIEGFHTAVGEFPDRNALMHSLDIALGDHDSNFRERAKALDLFLEHEETIKSLNERGIHPPWTLFTNPMGLTREQLAIVAVLLNPNDRRSDAKKLRDLGISERKYAGWMANKNFTAYYTKAANRLLEASEADAHMGLLRAVRTGTNTAATKLFFEMTGRWNPAYENQVNLQDLMMRFIEIIQTHVTDSEQLMKIANDLKLASLELGVSPNQAGQNSKSELENIKQPEPYALPVGEDDKFRKPERIITF